MLLGTPADGFRGTDSFEYSISDGNGGTDSATVTILMKKFTFPFLNNEVAVNSGTTQLLNNEGDLIIGDNLLPAPLLDRCSRNAGFRGAC